MTAKRLTAAIFLILVTSLAWQVNAQERASADNPVAENSPAESSSQDSSSVKNSSVQPVARPSLNEIVEWPAYRPEDAKKIKPRTFYLDRRIAPTMTYNGGADWLVRSTRQSEENTTELLANLGLKPGMVVADFGCGVGYHAIPIAQEIGAEGIVYAIDLQPEMLRALVGNAKSAGVENIQPVLTKGNVAQMPTKIFDVILMVDVYHELSNPAETLQQMHDALKADGVIALVEFRAEDPDVPILPVHKMSKEQILKEYEANGFELRSQYDNLPWQHLMFFGVKRES